MADSKTSAQDVIKCDLCDKPTQKFCNICQVSLCDDCVGKHKDEFQSTSHEIVHFLDRKVGGVEAHYEHPPADDIKEPAEVFERRILVIRNETQEIKEEVIPYYLKEDVKIENTISKAKAKFDDLGKETEKHRQLWHQDVDQIFDRMQSLRQSLRDENMNFLKTYQNKIRNLLSEMTKTVEQNERILKANKLSEVNMYQSKIKKYRAVPKKPTLKMPSFATNRVHGKELSIAFGDLRAILQQMSHSNAITDPSICYLTIGIDQFLNEPKVSTTILTNYKPLYSLACLGETEAWICGENLNLTRVDKFDFVKETVATIGPSSPQYISATKDGYLIYSVYEHSYSYKNNGMVNIVKNGKTETLITTPRHWRPVSLCCTRSGDILVYLLKAISTYGKKQNPKIVRYQGYTETQEIYLSFMDGSDSLFLAENNSGDICVSDVNVKAVVVFDKTGEDKFRYNGASAMRRRSFSPGCIVTDYLSQIIVTDINNDCLHILDQNGEFLRCVDNCGLENPFGLSVDSKGRLWVGLRDSGEIKVVEYIEQT